MLIEQIFELRGPLPPPLTLYNYVFLLLVVFMIKPGIPKQNRDAKLRFTPCDFVQTVGLMSKHFSDLLAPEIRIGAFENWKTV